GAGCPRQLTNLKDRRLRHVPEAGTVHARARRHLVPREPVPGHSGARAAYAEQLQTTLMKRSTQARCRLGFGSHFPPEPDGSTKQISSSRANQIASGATSRLIGEPSNDTGRHTI